MRKTKWFVGLYTLQTLSGEIPSSKRAFAQLRQASRHAMHHQRDPLCLIKKLRSCFSAQIWLFTVWLGSAPRWAVLRHQMTLYPAVLWLLYRRDVWFFETSDQRLQVLTACSALDGNFRQDDCGGMTFYAVTGPTLDDGAVEAEILS